MSTTSTPAGWYQDPQAAGTLRYFDGQAWSEHTCLATAIASTTVLPRESSFGERPSDPVHWLVPVGRSWQSLVAGYLGIFALFIWFLGPISLGMGVWALSAARHSGGHGRGRAWFAIGAGALATCLLVYVLGLSVIGS